MFPGGTRSGLGETEHRRERQHDEPRPYQVNGQVGSLPSHGRDTLFIYGGKWMAEPCYPEGLQENPHYGVSSNQQMLTVPHAADTAVDDYVFLRPTQSEAVFLQFGDLCVVRNDRHVGNWPVFRNEGFGAGAAT